jgi:hypothetical protein
MEETEAASAAAETNGVADHDDADMSSAENTCVTQSEAIGLAQRVRVHVASETVEYGPCLTRTRNQNAPSSKTLPTPNRPVLRLHRPQALPNLLQRPCHKQFWEQVRTLLTLTAVVSGEFGQGTAG